ncbi:MAG: ParB N-terminal domain-containing protein [Hyphomonadaceae bacterium]|nr:ParB N-terminal domain-containing protein [Hyphomonadaceae bacterium]
MWGSTKLEHVSIAALKPYAANARTHSKRQIKQIAQSIERFGFTNPVLVDDNLMILAGHGRVEAAKLLGMEEVPAVRVAHLSEADKRAYVLADNQLALKAGWDREILAIELQGLIDLNFDVGAIGFEVAEVDLILDAAREANPDARSAPEDKTPTLPQQSVTRLDDVWELGRHRLVCGDATDACAYAALLSGERADLVFTDPPYNVPIDGFVGGKGKVERREFAMAAGEMSEAEFEAFLIAALGPAAAQCRDGAIAFVCMDWRHMRELLNAGAQVFGELKNLCVWTKSNGGMGSLYRSQHELVFVFKKGGDVHINNVELGRFGRNRTNVWAYAGANAFGKARDEELAMHPTVKPVALVEDAIKDVSDRGGLVLDPFGGSGSTLIAAERCGRSARLIELDPLYCDVIVQRFETYTGKRAKLAGGDQTFEDLAVARRSILPSD